MAFGNFLNRSYQYYQLSSTFLYLALLARWIVLFPLVDSKFLPGGVHEFLIYLLFFCSIVEILWLFRFRGLWRGIRTKTMVKDLNFLYFVLIMHFYDDYEHALVLKNISYSLFIVALSCNQSYCHCIQIFKKAKNYKKRTLLWMLDTLITLPLLYLSEFYLLLLNVQNPNFHSIPVLDIINKVILVLYLPIAFTLYKNYILSQ